MNPNDIVIVAAKRTPIGALLGTLAPLSAPELGAFTHRAAILEAGITANDIDEVISGCVLQAGIGQAPARQAAIGAGIPVSAGATTINKMCGSGMKAVMLAHDLIKAGSAHIILAGGMESMTNAPYLLSKARAGYRLGHGELKDHMFLDGLEDIYEPGTLMGRFAEATAREYHVTREQQDAFAIQSMTRALSAQQTGAFTDELTPITISNRKGQVTITDDEIPEHAKIAKVEQLKPAFDKNGTVTAASSSSIADGAASLIVMTAANAAKRGLTPLAKIVSHATHAQEPQWFTTAPISAINQVLQKANWNLSDVDLFEINEAFAVVTMAAITTLKLDPDQVNIHGGACALGHPIGASGARILVTLIHALKYHHKKRGIAALCIGGGEATAMAIELVDTHA
ncbi:MAG: acetyl-CoA C-acyltransferase [Legionellaceae bacterium]|nr:acetyl-CoA C-acyltransferase [Legionellaceae bacterium]